VERGGKEELGLKIDVKKFLGSLITHFDRPDGTVVEKTTNYFLAEKKGETEKALANDEIDNVIIWVKTEEVIKLLKNCSNDEYKILSRIVN
jgi:hypothetical protein